MSEPYYRREACVKTPQRNVASISVMLEPRQIDWLDTMARNNRFGINNRSAVLRFILDHTMDILSDMNVYANLEKDEQ
jgi:hypothetical protein